MAERNSFPNVAKLSLFGQRARPIVYTKTSPGELFEGGSYFFNIGAERGVNLEGSFSSGELFKEIPYLRRQYLPVGSPTLIKIHLP